MNKNEIKKNVRQGYASVAKQSTSCCTPTTSCCGNPAQTISKAIGYSEQEMSSVPEGANLGLGCGNPLALASLKEGEENDKKKKSEDSSFIRARIGAVAAAMAALTD